MFQQQLQIIVWNVEHGSAIYVRTPNGRSIIMDAGASSDFSPARWLYYQYNISKADLFILSHADTDHIRDIENVDVLLSPYAFYRNGTSPRHLKYPTYPPTTNPLRYFHDFDARYSAPLTLGSPLTLDRSNWGNLAIELKYNQYPEHEFTKLNDYSVATFLMYGNLEFLFPGDLEAPGWEALMQRNDFRVLSTPSPTNHNEIRILVAAHHGREAGVYKPFLDLYRPHLTIVSDQYGSPYTANQTYWNATEGFPVYDRQTNQTRMRCVVSTKINDYILIRADPFTISASIG
jgi:competence protein ComEC